MNSQPLINNTIKKIVSLQVPHQQSIDAAVRRQSQLTKPEGALGKLEILAEFIAGVAAVPNPTLQRKTIMLAAADHGVAKEGVSAYPQEVTEQMVKNFLEGGAAINVLANSCKIDVKVIDAGINISSPIEGRLIQASLGKGTNNMLLTVTTYGNKNGNKADLELSIKINYHCAIAKTGANELKVNKWNSPS